VLPGFGKVITFASFENDGKCENHKQLLNRCVRKLDEILALVEDV
jgi:hypothetical protein